MEKNSVYRGNVSVRGKELTLKRELLSVGTHFTEGPSLSVVTRFTEGVTVCGKEHTLQRDRL